MSLYHSSKYKLRNIDRTIQSLLEGDFPVDSPREALLRLRDVFASLDKKLDRANRLTDTEALQSTAQNLNLKIYEILPILGIILRSTNVRNAFEMLEPLQRLARKALDGIPHVILSSEWDYVPFAYPQSLENLKSFIVIGLPASEAASALLLPLAGHELGHAVWRNQGIGASLQVGLQNKCRAHYRLPENKAEFEKYCGAGAQDDLFEGSDEEAAVGESSTYASLQAEELFADLFAYACFGRSYLRSFAYILAPGDGTCSPKYPTNSTRFAAIRKAAMGEQVPLPEFLELGLRHDGRKEDPRLNFVVKMSEAAVSDVLDDLWRIVLSVVEKGDIPRPRAERAEIHLKNIKIGIPSAETECVGDIINAGWDRYDEISGSGGNNDRLAELNEILLKTIEVAEFQRRISE